MELNDMDAGVKILIGCVILVILTGLTATIGVQFNNNRLIKEGYYQETVSYCSDYDLKTIWKK